MTEKTLEQLVAAYIQVRDKVAEIKAQQAADLKPYQEALSKLEFATLKLLDEAGVDSAKTKAGTAYLLVRTSVVVADKSSFMDYVTNNERFDLLDVRANKTAVEGMLSDDEDLPPGLNIRRDKAVGFRRS